MYLSLRYLHSFFMVRLSHSRIGWKPQEEIFWLQIILKLSPSALECSSADSERVFFLHNLSQTPENSSVLSWVAECRNCALPSPPPPPSSVFFEFVFWSLFTFCYIASVALVWLEHNLCVNSLCAVQQAYNHQHHQLKQLYEWAVVCTNCSAPGNLHKQVFLHLVMTFTHKIEKAGAFAPSVS